MLIQPTRLGFLQSSKQEPAIPTPPIRGKHPLQHKAQTLWIQTSSQGDDVNLRITQM